MRLVLPSYHNVVCAALDFVCDAPVPAGNSFIPTDARLAFFNETRHAYGRSALLLSGGAALGFYHIGVVKTLMANRLMPRVLGGSSAGSIVCAMIGTRTDEECERDMFDVRGTDAPGHSGRIAINFFRPLYLPMKNFPPGLGEAINNSAGAFRDAKRTWQVFVPIPLRHFTSLLYDLVTLKTRPQNLLQSDSEHFRECLRINIGDFTFQEAFDRTGRITNITGTSHAAAAYVLW
jgi:TAG lipase/steryl ester hydrolase/phospholipase A2/LPA acyltransferase